jgi:hypothetical protein
MTFTRCIYWSYSADTTTIAIMKKYYAQSTLIKALEGLIQQIARISSNFYSYHLPIHESLLPKGKVHSYRTPKVVDFFHRPLSVLRSTYDTFVPHPTIAFNVRKNVCEFLAYLPRAAVGPPTVVRSRVRAASVADSQRAPSLIRREKLRHVVRRHVQQGNLFAGGVAADRDCHCCLW